MKRITIIGAGIGGLTAAIALQQKGFTIEIFENTRTFGRVGSGINLALNAMQVYKRLGIYNDILARAHVTNSMNLRSKSLGILAALDLKKLATDYKVQAAAIHRAELHEVLLRQLENVTIHRNKKLIHVEQINGLVHLSFSDGTEHQAELVIGADGINSAVRQSIFENSELRDAEQVCWRGISSATLGSSFKNELNEIWGKGDRFGFVHINKEEVYWFALINKDKFNAHKNIDLLKQFSDYHPMVQDIIAETPQENIMYNELWDLKPIPKWYEANVCLLGDAAHATTPNMGQGAVQAVESAMALSICLAEESSVEKAFARYQSIRMDKANHVTNTSWKIGKLAQLNNPIGIVLRNILLKITPSKITELKNRKLYDLNY